MRHQESYWYDEYTMRLVLPILSQVETTRDILNEKVGETALDWTWSF